MKLRKGDIVGIKQSLGKIQWIEGEKAGLENFVLDIGFVPILSSLHVMIGELEFIHRPFDYKGKQLMFPFYSLLLEEDEGKARELMRDYQDKMDRKRGVSEHLLHKPKKTMEKKIEDKLKGMRMEDILKLLED